MSTEELKMILDVLTRVTDTTGNAAIWWMALHYGVGVINVAIVVGGLCFAVALIVRAAMHTSDWANQARAISKAWGGEGETYVMRRDREALRAAIERSSGPSA
jgi:hypothetical protein